MVQSTEYTVIKRKKYNSTTWIIVLMLVYGYTHSYITQEESKLLHKFHIC